jgi:protocatechuate 3,4-dioxygenase beta subunit
MNFIRTSLCLFLLALPAAAQTSTAPAQAPARATIDGRVTKDPTGEPVKKTLIELIAENQSEGGDYTATTDPDGTFHIEGILPGRYRLFAERTGYLEGDKHQGRSQGRVLTLAAGQELKDVEIRLQAAAVVRGRVTDEDGDPMPDAQVAVLRQTYMAGRSRWEQVGSERTNDLGEFRVANLPAGNYYVSVSPPPDFRSLISEAGGNAHDTSEKPSETYQTTYYPGTADRSQAAPVQLRAGDDFPVNFSLTPSPSLSIRGSVVNLPAHSSASIMLQSRDFGVAFNGAEIHKDGTFVIRDVSPGSYTILATVDNSPTPLTARQPLQVASTNIEGLRLVPQPGAQVRAHLRVEGKTKFDPNQIFLALQASDRSDEPGVLSMADVFSNVSHISGDGSFEWKDVPAGTYYVQLVGQGESGSDLFVKSVSGANQNDSTIAVNGGSVALDVVVSANGGVIDGVATDAKGQPIANAVVVAAPEAKLRGRFDRYRKTVTDQTGHFTLHGIVPADYTLFAWDSVDGEAYYNSDFLSKFENQGTAVHVSEADRKSVQLNVIDTNDEP